jgi:UDP-N-acetylglucosamine--N-acetylmuramyl-(pentapeptide) pyrophosphoryl-undecaprenol N-acetylglucosamine transferase
MADGGAAVVIPDSELSPERLSAAIAALLSDEDRLRAMSIAARRLAQPDAAERIAREILEALRRGGSAGGAEEPPVS